MAPKLVYFPIAGRGELSRLIAAVGGIEGFESLHALPEGMTPSDFGSTGTMPLLMDGDDLKINESGAIEAYLSLIAPKYANLTPKQRARDAQFSQLKESALSGVAKIIFNGADRYSSILCSFFSMLWLSVYILKVLLITIDG